MIRTYFSLTQSKEHVYYRWKLLSLINNDTYNAWSLDPIKINDRIYIPPHMPFYESVDDETGSEYSVDSESDSSIGHLDSTKQRRLEYILRKLEPTHASIGQAMFFCILHSKSCQRVLDIIFASILSPLCSIHMKVTRFLLISDILHNCKFIFETSTTVIRH